MSYHPDQDAAFLEAARRIAALEAQLAAIRAVVNAQAEDVALWLPAVTAPEAYIQRELRRLHATVDGEK